MTKKITSKSKKPKKQGDGTLVIVGGHEDKENETIILKEVVKHLNGRKLIVSTVASEEPSEYFREYHKVFTRLGVKEITEIYVEDRNKSLNEEKMKTVEGAAGVYFTGGDQLRISSQIGDTPFENHVWEIYRQGGVIAGTSAGASVMAEVMLVRGSGNESYKLGDVHLAPGLGFMRNVIIDQHFAERGRIGRLLGAVALNPRILGIGIDEDTAIVVRGKQFTVIGSGAVYIVDGSQVTSSNIAEAKADSVLSIFDVKLHVLSDGDIFNLSSRKLISKISREE